MVERTVRTLPIKRLIEMRDAIDLDAEYQRNNIWSSQDKGLLIDSILTEIDIPKVYLARFDDQYECIDGKQRLLTIFEFVDGDIFKYRADEAKGEALIEANLAKLKKNEQEAFYNYQLTIVEINDPSDEHVRKLFRRLQLGKVLNGGEILKSLQGKMRDFIYKEAMNTTFMEKVGIGGKRFGKELTLAQLTYSSFSKTLGKFKRARLSDLERFFYEKRDYEYGEKTKLILNVLNEMGAIFTNKDAEKLTSKVSVVSAYLFCEELYERKQQTNLKKFPIFYLLLLKRVKDQMLLQKARLEGEEPEHGLVENNEVIKNFGKYMQQASAEPYSINYRHEFLKMAFEYYSKTGKIVGDGKVY